MELKENEYLLLRKDEVKHLKEDEHGGCTLYFDSDSKPKSVSEIVELSCGYFIEDDEQLIRGLERLLDHVVNGVEESACEMKETEGLDYLDIFSLIKKVIKKSI